MGNETLFDELALPQIEPTNIMVVGIGGAGGNAVNRMCDLNIQSVAFVACNTDRRALNKSKANIKIQLGEGLGAGNKPERGRAAAIEGLDGIVELFKNEEVNLLFITAGMGGGTGTGAAPIISKAAKDLGILTIGIVTQPYLNEGPLRNRNAAIGIEEMKTSVDFLIVINSDNIQEIYGELSLSEAFGKADNILATAVQSIANIVTRDAFINIDFADVCTVMRDRGTGLMGTGRSCGVQRAPEAIELALLSPLLNENSIEGATQILLNISHGKNEITLQESNYIKDYIINMSGGSANIIWGVGGADGLDDNEIEVTVIVGFYLNVNKSAGGKHIAHEASDERDDQMWIPPMIGMGGSFAGPFDAFERKVTPMERGKGLIKFIDDRRRYKDIDRILITPAYVRRKVSMPAAIPNNNTQSFGMNDKMDSFKANRSREMFNLDGSVKK